MPELTDDYVEWKLAFHGGGTYHGATPERLLRNLSKRQFDEEDARNIKAALAWRAWVWSEALLDVNMPDREFLIAYAETGTADLSAYSEGRDEWLTF